MMQTPKRYRLGLVVGKFSPLHQGHEHVIDSAHRCCDQVLVLGYSQPEFRGCERLRRTAWINDRFPDVINIQLDDAEIQRRCRDRGIAHQPLPHNSEPDLIQQLYLAWLLIGPIGLRPDAMFGSEHYIQPCAALLSEQLGSAVSPVCVDLNRERHPISATRIRQDIHASRQWLAPVVYKDFVPRIVLLGGESCGKTTLAKALATHYRTAWVPEYGRERWDLQNGQLSLDDLIDIGHVQTAKEQALHLEAHSWLFCDTSPLTTLGYAGWMFDQQPTELIQLAERRYDMAILCHPDFEFVQDGTRRDEAFRLEQHAWYLAQLKARGIPWIDVRGHVAERVDQVNTALTELKQRMAYGQSLG